MKYQRKRFAAISTAFVIAAAPFAVDAQPSADSGVLGVQGISDEDATAIQQIIVNTATDLTNGNIDAYAQYWVEGGVLMPMDHPRIVGRDSIVDFVSANFTMGTEVTFADWDFAGRDDLAVVTNNAVFSPGSSNESEAIDQIIVMRRQDDGRWMVQAAIWTIRSSN